MRRILVEFWRGSALLRVIFVFRMQDDDKKSEKKTRETMFINRRKTTKRTNNNNGNVTPSLSSNSQHGQGKYKSLSSFRKIDFLNILFHNRRRTRLLLLSLCGVITIILSIRLLHRNSFNRKVTLLSLHETSLFGEVEDFSIGKSCFYNPGSGRWQCQDCGIRDDNNKNNNKSKNKVQCKTLPRRNKCSPFTTQGWDSPKPRSSSSYNSKFIRGQSNIITKYGVGKINKEEYEQAQCSLHPMNGASQPVSSLCFDLDRCIVDSTSNNNHNNSTNNNSNKVQKQMQLPMKVFLHGNYSETLFRNAFKKDKDLSSLMEITKDPNSACLFFAHYREAVETTKSPHWNFGKNHFILKENTGDHPFGKTQHAMAALGHRVFTDANFRPGYDVSTPMWPKWKVPQELKAMANDVYRERPYLMSFKGTIVNSFQPFYQHRWLAAEYLWEEPDFRIDVRCKKMSMIPGREKRVVKPYEVEPSPEDYNDLMLNSTFGFCPGGSSITSYRFTEYLSAGAIPVIVAGTIPPLSPEVDWSNCLVTVSEARIVDLRRILRDISREEVLERRRNCRNIYSSLFQSNDFAISYIMRIWVQRIENAIEEREKLKDLNKLVVGKTW